MKLDQTILSVTADLFVNIAAGWIGAIIIVPNFSEKKGREKGLVLILDSAAAIICIGIAVIFKQYEK